MKGYYTSNGYVGYVMGEGYRLFETENAYYEWLLDAHSDLFSYKGEEVQ